MHHLFHESLFYNYSITVQQYIKIKKDRQNQHHGVKHKNNNILLTALCGKYSF